MLVTIIKMPVTWHYIHLDTIPGIFALNYSASLSLFFFFHHSLYHFTNGKIFFSEFIVRIDISEKNFGYLGNAQANI